MITIIICDTQMLIFFSSFFWPKTKVCIIHKNYIINFFSSHMPHHIQEWMTKKSYIYVIHRQTVSFYQNSSVWLDTQDAQSRDRNPSNFTLD